MTTAQTENKWSEDRDPKVTDTKFGSPSASVYTVMRLLKSRSVGSRSWDKRRNIG